MRRQRDDINRFFEYDVDINTRTVYLGSYGGEGDAEVDSRMAERAIKALHLLDSQNRKAITIILNSTGGDVYHGMSVYDAIKACKSKVTIKVMGQAMSMGAVILQAGHKRLIAPNARVMIHYGSMGLEPNHSKIFKKWADECARLDVEMENLLLERIKQTNPRFTRKKLQELCNFDTIMTASEAVQLGLADGIIGDTE